jgi:uncharacterized protein YneF (UPF0154 family)
MIRGFALDVFQDSCRTAVFQIPLLILCFFACILGSQLLGNFCTMNQARLVLAENTPLSQGTVRHILYSIWLSGFASFFTPIPLDCVNRDKKANAQNRNKYTHGYTNCQNVYKICHFHHLISCSSALIVARRFFSV